MPRKSSEKPLHLYSDMAQWFHLLTAPEDYREEAGFYRKVLLDNSMIPVKTVLEMGSGGGNNAFYFKAHFTMILTDLSKDMLALSQKINPECEHIPGDMRNMRLGRQFDAVFVQDAISYMNTESYLAAAMETAFIHCKPGGVAMFCPDYIRETFKSGTQHGGHDGEDRAMRYLEWTWDPDSGDSSYVADFVYLFKEGQSISSEHERHTLGLFAEKDWHRLLVKVGFISAKKIHYPVKMKLATPVFMGIKPL